MNIKRILFLPFLIIAICTSHAQTHRFRSSGNHFVKIDDTVEFKRINPQSDGFGRFYFYSRTAFYYDRNDDDTTIIRINHPALLCVEGQVKHYKREGIFNYYLIDSLDHRKRYRIWEQSFVNDKLNGRWNCYTLEGALINFQTYKNDSVDGLGRVVGIDGKKIMHEIIYFNGHAKSIDRFFEDGKLESEWPTENGVREGVVIQYYPDGHLKESREYKEGKQDGPAKYFYPNGQVWIEQIYKQGKPWKVVANYTDKGRKRAAGTLDNGNGTVIYYNEDGTIRETATYVDGKSLK